MSTEGTLQMTSQAWPKGLDEAQLAQERVSSGVEVRGTRLLGQEPGGSSKAAPRAGMRLLEWLPLKLA